MNVFAAVILAFVVTANVSAGYSPDFSGLHDAVNCINKTVSSMNIVVEGLNLANTSGLSGTDSKFLESSIQLIKQFVTSKVSEADDDDIVNILRYSQTLFDFSNQFTSQIVEAAKKAIPQRQIDDVAKKLKETCVKLVVNRDDLEKLINNLAAEIKEPCKTISEKFQKAFEINPVSFLQHFSLI